MRAILGLRERDKYGRAIWSIRYSGSEGQRHAMEMHVAMGSIS